MASKKITLQARLKGAGKTKRGLKGIDSGLKSMGKSAIAAGAAFFGGRAIIAGLQKTIELSSKMEGLRRGFDNLAKSAGFSAQTFNKLQKATDGTMSSFDLMKQANNAMLLGIFESDDQMAKMFDTAQRLAQALGKDAAFGIESLVTGMGRQSKLMLDNLGIMVKAEDAYKRHAEDLHKSVSELTDMERKQAFVNEAMKEANSLVKNLGDEQLTTADAINQMKTALGDVAAKIGESLSPLITSLAKGVKSLATETGGETTEARKLFRTIKDLNTSEKVRKDAIASINTLYGDYLPNLLNEKTSLGDIEKAQNRVTNALLKRIALSVNEERIRDLMSEQLDLRNKEPDLIDKVAEAQKSAQDATEKRIAIEEKLGGIQIDIMARAEEGRKNAFESSKKLRLAENREEQISNQKEINKLNEDAVTLAEQFSNVIVGMPERPSLPLPDEEDLEILEDVVINMKEWDMLMGKTSDEPENIDSMKNQINVAQQLQAALSLAFSPKMEGGDKVKQMAIQMASLMEGVIISAGAVNTSLASMFAGPFGWLKIAAALITLEAVKAKMRSEMVEAATGFDGIVTKPTLFMTGEGNKAERVSVTPLQGPNIDGPQGGITLNISAPLVDETVIDSIIPAIQKAQRLNLA